MTTWKLFCLCFVLLTVVVSTTEAGPTVFIVRHAEKANSTDDPDISAAGRARAGNLARLLKDAGITAIYATEFKRTQQTAAPLAKALDVKVTIIPTNEKERLFETMRQQSGNILVVGHTNTVPDVIKALGVSTPVSIAETEFDNLFIVILEEKPRLLRLHFE
jgi:broad specificity phosphatase PhoE